MAQLALLSVTMGMILSLAPLRWAGRGGGGLEGCLFRWGRCLIWACRPSATGGHAVQHKLHAADPTKLQTVLCAHPIHIKGCLVLARRARVPSPLKNWLIAAACLAFTSGVTTAARGPAGW